MSLSQPCPLVLQRRRRARSVRVTSLAGEGPTKMDPDISVHPTGHSKHSANVQLAQETEGSGTEATRIHRLSSALEGALVLLTTRVEMSKARGTRAL